MAFFMPLTNEESMHDYDIQITLDDLARTFEEFKKINEERLTSLEKKDHVDPLLQEKMARLEGHLDQAELRLKQMEILNNRPPLESNPEFFCTHKRVFMDYIRKGLDAPLYDYERKS